MTRPKGQTIRFPEDILEKLESLSEETGLSINKIVIKIVKENFEKKNRLIEELKPEYKEIFLGKDDNELKQWLLKEIIELSDKYDKLEERIDQEDSKNK